MRALPFVGTTISSWLGFAFAIAACQKAVPAPAEAQASTGVPTLATGQAALEGKPHAAEFKRLEAPAKVFAIGDLHGDLLAAKAAFRVAGVIAPDDTWIGGNSVVVQTGDVLDRGNDERPLLEWLERLAQAARTAGGALHRINGNHEIMNVAGDLRYVTPGGFAAFADYASSATQPGLGELPEVQRGRLAAFLPGGPWAKRLAEYPIVIQVNDTVFAHGGVTLKHVEYGLERMNSEVSSWMRGSRPLPKALQGDDTPFWDRTYGDAVTESDCKMLEQVLARLAAKRLVVGHTPQRDGITFACEGRVARIDVGLSRYYGQHAPAVLKIENASVQVVTEASHEQSSAEKHPTEKHRAKSKARGPLEARP